MEKHSDREPMHVQSDALDPEVVAELEAAYEQKAVVEFDDMPWLVQKVEAHRDPGPGAQIQRFTLIPADPDEVESGQS